MLVAFGEDSDEDEDASNCGRKPEGRKPEVECREGLGEKDGYKAE